MKKKTIRNWFVVIFILGLVAGLIVPVDLKTISRKMPGQGLKPEVFDVSKRLGQLDADANYFKYSVLAQTDTGSVELMRVDDKIPMHAYKKGNQFVYIYRGTAKATVGSSVSEVSAGQMVSVPAGSPNSIERIGDAPVEIILFSAPPFAEKDIVWIEK